jgi:predicted acylesterase/phospholipase RssA
MKRALITSGGGAKGAFSVGALQALFENGIDSFDIISGTSTGALIAIFAAVKDLNTLIEEYTETQTSDILQPQNLTSAIYSKQFLYNTLPLQEKLNQRVSDQVAEQVLNMDTIICLTAVGLRSGRITVFTTKTLNIDTEEFDQVLIESPQMLRDAMLASSSQAVFLKPVEMTVNINGKQVTELFIDGGNRDVIPTRVPILLGVEQLFVLSNNPLSIYRESQEELKNIFGILKRTIAIFVQEIRESNYRRIEEAGITSINIQPEKELDLDHPTGLRFNQDNMISWFVSGQEIAKAKLGALGLIT